MHTAKWTLILICALMALGCAVQAADEEERVAETDDAQVYFPDDEPIGHEIPSQPVFGGDCSGASGNTVFYCGGVDVFCYETHAKDPPGWWPDGAGEPPYGAPLPNP